jgi:DNA-directed RNA polymerase subunit M/transcription elongation factor TFIIS
MSESYSENLRFCSSCRNVMDAVADKNELKWRCSIECPLSEKKPDEVIGDDKAIVLSRTEDDDINIHLNPLNDYTVEDRTLLRCMRTCIHSDRPEHRGDRPDEQSEMIIFKQNIATNASRYICTKCGQTMKITDL